MMKYQDEADALLKAAWPKCDTIASKLQAYGISALPALEFAAKSRVHHARSACLRSINALDTEKGRAMADAMLRDRAYEVRETAAKILGIAVPDKP
jgi:hypothetical protein